MFVLDKGQHSIYDLFKMFLFSYDVDGLNITSLINLDLFFGCFETISLLLQFYRRLFISLNISGHEIMAGLIA